MTFHRGVNDDSAGELMIHMLSKDARTNAFGRNRLQKQYVSRIPCIGGRSHEEMRGSLRRVPISWESQEAVKEALAQK